jgi:hypothetical protein
LKNNFLRNEYFAYFASLIKKINLMYSTKFLFPTLSGGSTTTDGTRPVTNSKTPTLPRGDDDLLAVAQRASTKWTGTPAITLVWMTAPNFATLVGNFATEIGQRDTAGGARSPLTDSFNTINEKIDDAIPFVKGYIAGKYGASHATSHYAPFGIVHRKEHWEFPVDHDERKAALDMMVAAIAAEGFGAFEYGTTFWTDARTEFNTLLSSTSGADQTISTEVSQKNQLKTQVKRVLQALIYVLHGNYPDTYFSTLREWGIIKQDF